MTTHPASTETSHLNQRPEGKAGQPEDARQQHAAPSENVSHPKRGEHARTRGKLKIFFSYAPGAGKTLAMLEDAYRQLQEGRDVVAGFVDAHGEVLAMQLLQQFEMLPQRMLSSSGFLFQGMDLDAILKRMPQIVLVDHLAQSNPPGLRHEARYLEVEELLSAGIDVYTTVNVYHLESQRDTVEQLTGITPRETIPDRFLDTSEKVEMVDIPPQELLDRYSSGQVYTPIRSEVMLEKLFQLPNLFALRELALRYVARRSNAFMRSFLQGQDRTREKARDQLLLVCITSAPESARLIRAGRRMADETASDWTVIHVETPDQIVEEADNQASVAQHMRLAEMMGANTEIITGRSAADALREYVHKNRVRRILIGRSPGGRWPNLMGASLAEKILRGDPTISIFIVGSDNIPRPFQVNRIWNLMSRLQLVGSLALVVIPTILGLLLTPTVISRSANLIMLYLLSVVISSVFLGLVPAILTTVLSVLAFDYFFVPPYYVLFGFAIENAITFISLLVVSLIISTLVSRERALTRAAQRRADQVTQLYELSRDLASAVAVPDIMDTVLSHIQRTFAREAVILLPHNDKLILSASSNEKGLDSSELTAAEWAYQQGRPAGYNTGTFSYASFRYFPLETTRGIIGVIGVQLSGDQPDLHPEQVRLLGTFVTKAASALERALFAEEASQAEILRATEKLQTALLNSISHDLRTPLASITGVLDSMRLEDAFLDEETRAELVETAYGEAVRLNRLVGNLLDMSRLESGSLRISRQPCDIQDVVGSSLAALTSRLEGRSVSINIPSDLPLVPLDYVLIQQVLVNLLDNAAKYAPENAPIEINSSQIGEAVQIEVCDRGPGIPEEDLDHIFEKFFRVKRFENVVGTGLGLSICKGIVEGHGGKIWAENRVGGGSRLVFLLPLKSPVLAEREPAAV